MTTVFALAKRSHLGTSLQFSKATFRHRELFGNKMALVAHLTLSYAQAGL